MKIPHCPACGQPLIEDGALDLTPTQRRIVELLQRRKEMSGEDLRNTIWTHANGGPDSASLLHAHIWHLNKRLRAHGLMVRASRWSGYRIIEAASDVAASRKTLGGTIMRWFRMYAEARCDPKLEQLSDREHRAWFKTLCLASEYGGEIPVAILTRALSPRKDYAQRMVKVLVSAGLLVEGGGLIIPHNWFVRQYKSDTSAERMRRYRARRSDVTSTVTGRYAVTDTEKKVSKKAKRLSDDGASLDAEIQPTDIASLRNIRPLNGGKEDWP